MRIIHISTSDVAGGAARAAYRVHSGLKRLGHDSRMLVQKKWSVDPAITKFTPGTRFADRVRRKLRRKQIAADFAQYKSTRPPDSEQFTDDRTEWRDEPLRGLPDCDIVNFHWVGGFVDHIPFFDFFANERPKVPLFWRMADMAPLTGGCHYDQGCGKFADRCGACPSLGSSDHNDLSRQIWERKNRALSTLSDGGLHLVATSRWIAAEAKKSSLLGRFGCTIIPNALDTEIFQPRDKMFSRDLLGISRDGRVVLFAADSAKHKRKGFAELAAAVEGISGIDNLVLLSAGGGQPKLGASGRLINLGKIDDDRILSIAYSAADVYVIPSLQEAFGQTVIEAMACGTPTVGFASGGITDTVRPGETGLLAPTGDVDALRGAIVDLLNDPVERARLGERCRQIALADYSFEVQARQYESMYAAAVARASSP